MDRYFDPNNLTAAKTRKLIQRNYFYHSLPYFYQSLEIQSEEKNEQFRGVFKLIPFSFESDAIFRARKSKNCSSQLRTGDNLVSPIKRKCTRLDEEPRGGRTIQATRSRLFHTGICSNMRALIPVDTRIRNKRLMLYTMNKTYTTSLTLRPSLDSISIRTNAANFRRLFHRSTRRVVFHSRCRCAFIADKLFLPCGPEEFWNPAGRKGITEGIFFFFLDLKDNKKCIHFVFFSKLIIIVTMRWKLRIKKGWVEFRMKVIRLRKFYNSLVDIFLENVMNSYFILFFFCLFFSGKHEDNTALIIKIVRYNFSLFLRKIIRIKWRISISRSVKIRFPC